MLKELVFKVVTILAKSANIVLPTLLLKKDKKKHLVFYAKEEFHAKHFYPLLMKLQNVPDFEIHLVGEFEPIFDAKYYSRLKYISLRYRYSLFFTTTLSLPWNIVAKTIYFGHGVGPKLDYNSEKLVSNFDYCFCSCEPIYQVQSALNEKCFKVGLPILELKSNIDRSFILSTFNLTGNKPIIVYVPSWHGNPDLISEVLDYAKKLDAIDDFDLIVSPHPNLMKAEYTTEKTRLDHFNSSALNWGREISSLDLIKEAADIVVSDISSLLYEAMALGKLVAFDGNRTLYEESGAGHILQSMDDFLFQCSWCSDLSSQFASLLENTKSHELQAEFIQGYVYNIENAADISFELTKKLVE
jgi:hypothetical protein